MNGLSTNTILARLRTYLLFLFEDSRASAIPDPDPRAAWNESTILPLPSPSSSSSMIFVIKTFRLSRGRSEEKQGDCSRSRVSQWFSTLDFFR